MFSTALVRVSGSVLTRGISFALLLLVLSTVRFSCRGETADPWISPSAVALSLDGRTAYVASATSGEVLFLDLESGDISHRLALAGEPSGLALSVDGQRLLATSSAAHSRLYVIDVPAAAIAFSVPAGHTAVSPVLSADGATAYLCNRFNNDIAVIDLAKQKEIRRIKVQREPVGAALSRDGRHLLVANRLPVGRVDVGTVSANVSVVDLEEGKVVKEIVLPNGANFLQSLKVSPDGLYACVTHTLARFQLPTTQVERGWMNANALSLIDLSSLSLISTILLDCPEKGCAIPWGAEWNEDGSYLAVTHAGTHEVSIIDFPGLMAKLQALPTQPGAKSGAMGYVVARVRSEVSNDLGFLGNLRKLIPLRGNGPRPVAIRDRRICVGNYFSESLEVIDVGQLDREPVQVFLHEPRPRSDERDGEAYFNDARLCMQTWQSCASCHSTDARVDALNWDLLNDGVGNPKNTRSLLRSHWTAPVMSLGVRASAEVAVRAGIHHILFMVAPEDKPQAMDQWLMTLKPGSSPYLVCGTLSPQAERGKELFYSKETACAVCHSSDLYTDRRLYDVGTSAPTDRPGDVFDTPVLFELWRTGPYLHDGSAATLREVLRERNQSDRHGRTSHLSDSQIDDLVAYLLSL